MNFETSSVNKKPVPFHDFYDNPHVAGQFSLFLTFAVRELNLRRRQIRFNGSQPLNPGSNKNNVRMILIDICIFYSQVPHLLYCFMLLTYCEPVSKDLYISYHHLVHLL